MGNIIARALVRCPMQEADRGLLSFFERNADIEGATAQLELPADVQPLRPASTISLEGPAVATIAAGVDQLDRLPSYTVQWRPKSGAPFPTFVGSLWLSALADDRIFELLLVGRYEPPIGTDAGSFRGAADRTAQFMAQHLLRAVADSIEAAKTGPAREEGERARHGTRPHRR